VNGPGYTFTRHNNKLTMNINSDVFFSDQQVPIIKPFPNRGVAIRRRESSPLTQKPQQQRLGFIYYVCILSGIFFSPKASYVELLKKLEERWLWLMQNFSFTSRLCATQYTTARQVTSSFDWGNSKIRRAKIWTTGTGGKGSYMHAFVLW